MADIQDEAASRRLIVGALLLAVGWGTVGALVDPRGHWARGLVVLVSLLFLGASIVFTALSQRRSRMAAFVVREGHGFIAPLSRDAVHLVVGQILMFGVLGGKAIASWLGAAGEPAAHTVIDQLAKVGSMAVFVGIAFASTLVAAALRGMPRVELTPHGITELSGLGRRTTAWEALGPGLPRIGSRGFTLTLAVDRPELIVRRGLIASSRRMEMNLFLVASRASFLAGAIRHYVERPDRRAAIGTRAEYDRLWAELSGAIDCGHASRHNGRHALDRPAIDR